MSKINLLPWREERRKQLNNFFLVTTGAFLFVVFLIILSIITIISGKIDSQKRNNEILRAEISTIENSIKEIDSLRKERDGLLARMKVIQELGEKRVLVVQFMDELAKNVPDGLVIDSIKKTGDAIEIKGESSNNSIIADFLKKLELIKNISNIVLVEISNVSSQAGASSGMMQFQISAQLSIQQPTASGDTPAASPGTPSNPQNTGTNNP